MATSKASDARLNVRLPLMSTSLLLAAGAERPAPDQRWSGVAPSVRERVIRSIPSDEDTWSKQTSGGPPASSMAPSIRR